MKLINYEVLGFTLAEVLITLGIIGVVAAMTIPTLIANTKGQQFRSQFKKTLSSLNQAALMNKANYGWDFADTEERICGDPITDNQNCKSVSSILNANLQASRYIGYWEAGYPLKEHSGYVSHFSPFVYGLADGSWFGFTDDRINGVPCTLRPGEILDNRLDPDDDDLNYFCGGFIDINGKQGPNEEVHCSNGVETKATPSQPCVVNNSDITDIFPVVFHDSTVEPATNAARYVLNTAK